jgi:hypothetical protein
MSEKFFFLLRRTLVGFGLQDCRNIGGNAAAAERRFFRAR